MNDKTRTLGANALMWALLADFAEQKTWMVNNYECKMEVSDWKVLLSACFKKEAQRIAQGIDGGIVLLGAKTSKMKVDEMSEFLEYIQSVGASMNIKFSAPSFRVDND